MCTHRYVPKLLRWGVATWFRTSFKAFTPLPCRTGRSRRQCSARSRPWQPAWRRLEAAQSSLDCPRTSTISRLAPPFWAAWLPATPPGCSRMVINSVTGLFCAESMTATTASQLPHDSSGNVTLDPSAQRALASTHIATLTHALEPVTSRALLSVVHYSLVCDPATLALQAL